MLGFLKKELERFAVITTNERKEPASVQRVENMSHNLMQEPTTNNNRAINGDMSITSVPSKSIEYTHSLDFIAFIVIAHNSL